ncbi:MAG: hypothetical protein WCL14_01020 [Bacteroidota bacterium]
MSTLIINSENKDDLKLFKELAKRLGLSSKILTEEEKEDHALLLMMNEADLSKKVSEASILKKLRT